MRNGATKRGGAARRGQPAPPGEQKGTKAASKSQTLTTRYTSPIPPAPSEATSSSGRCVPGRSLKPNRRDYTGEDRSEGLFARTLVS